MNLDETTEGLDFTKYQDHGAYHWGKLEGRGLRSRHSRLWARYEWFLRRVPRDADLIIDIGCGDGALTHLLSGVSTAEVIGVEPEVAGVELASSKLSDVNSRARVVAGSGEALPIADGTADAVTLCEVIEHLEEPERVLAEAARVLRQDGALLISTPRRQAQPTDPFAVQEFSPGELGDLCGQYFERVEIFIAEPPWLMRAWDTRLGRVAINSLALAKRNPFHRLASPGRPARSPWRQLYAVVHHPLDERSRPSRDD